MSAMTFGAYGSSKWKQLILEAKVIMDSTDVSTKVRDVLLVTDRLTVALTVACDCIEELEATIVGLETRLLNRGENKEAFESLMKELAKKAD